MKKIFKKQAALLTQIIGLVTITGILAQAADITFKPNTPMEKIVLSCFVPTEDGQPQGPKLYATLTKDTSADFLTVYLLEGTTKTIFFYQTSKDVVGPQLEKNSIDFPLMSETTQSENGVLKNTGYFILSPSSNPSTLSGLAMAKGNLYPLACAKGEQLPQIIKNINKLPLQ